ncbi:MAG: hypothetical protein JKY92_03135 [Magnetovibrio sp.]|nr:hypothetical protein [Magnetovibrio sp.]
MGCEGHVLDEARNIYSGDTCIFTEAPFVSKRGKPTKLGIDFISYESKDYSDVYNIIAIKKRHHMDLQFKFMPEHDVVLTDLSDALAVLSRDGIIKRSIEYAVSFSSFLAALFFFAVTSHLLTSGEIGYAGASGFLFVGLLFFSVISFKVIKK